VSFLPSDKGVIKIDLAVLSSNFSTLASFMEQGKGSLMPVIKSDAYGHGMEWVAKALENKPLWGFGVYECSEARALRRAGIRNRIFLLSGLLQDSPDEALELSITVGVVKKGELSLLDKIAGENGKRLPIHLKVDTGMARFGLEPKELIEIVRKRHKWPNLLFEGLYTHLSSSDTPHDPHNKRQITEFNSVLSAVQDKGWRPEFIHMANSAALIHLPETRFNLARPGIAIYGALCTRGLDVSQLRPVMGFYSRLCQVKTFAAGTSFSYGHTFTCSRQSRIGIIPVGYDNGYPRALSNKASVLIGGKRCRIVGNICMRASLVDVTDLEHVREGQEVVLLGSSGQEEIRACELAQEAGTISYELLCLLGKLNKRVILG